MVSVHVRWHITSRHLYDVVFFLHQVGEIRHDAPDVCDQSSESKIMVRMFATKVEYLLLTFVSTNSLSWVLYILNTLGEIHRDPIIETYRNHSKPLTQQGNAGSQPVKPNGAQPRFGQELPALLMWQCRPVRQVFLSSSCLEAQMIFAMPLALLAVQGAVAFVPQDLPGGFNAPISWQDKAVKRMSLFWLGWLQLFSVSWMIPICRQCWWQFVYVRVI